LTTNNSNLNKPLKTYYKPKT